MRPLMTQTGFEEVLSRLNRIDSEALWCTTSAWAGATGSITGGHGTQGNLNGSAGMALPKLRKTGSVQPHLGDTGCPSRPRFSLASETDISRSHTGMCC